MPTKSLPLKERLNLADDPVFLMDGTAFLYRSFFANQHLRRSDGFPTGALTLLARLLLRILRGENPRWLLFALDGRGENFRHKIYPLYKANRDATPEHLVAQIEPSKRLVRALGLRLEVSSGCEADDCIASLAARFSLERPVVIVSGDKDLKQCLSPSVFMWDPAGGREKLVTEQSFVEESGVLPGQWPDAQALIGDASDNIPGVPGIGPAAAGQLFSVCHGLEDIRDNLARLPVKFQKKLQGHLDKAFVWRQLTTLSRTECADLSLDDLAVRPCRAEEIRALCGEFELAALRGSVEALLRARPGPDMGSSGGKAVSTGLKAKQGQGSLWEAVPHRDEAACREARCPEDLPDCAGRVAVVLAGGAGIVLGLAPADGAADDMTEARRVWKGDGSALLSWLARARRVVCDDFKKLLGLAGDAPAGALEALVRKSFDLGLADWLTEPDEGDYSLAHIASRLGRARPGLNARRPRDLAIMAELLRARLRDNGLEQLYVDMEMPLVPLLADMERAGIAIDPNAFSAFLAEVRREIDSLVAGVCALAGVRFNLRSARQLGEVLYGRLGLPAPRRTRGGQASTAQESLEKLAGRHKIVDLILQYRKYEKLRSTYLEPLPRLRDARGRVHTTFNQKGTATGRLSSSNPNLQNIPARGELGRRMRACFIAAPGHALVCADYSQIELRVLAHMSRDAALLDAFRRNEDIHARTAALIYDVPPERVSPDQRRDAKTVNFGLIYGMGAQKLAQDLGISAPQARAFIERYFARLAGLKSFYAHVADQAQQDGFVVTLGGRRRFLPGIGSANGQTGAQARRQAVNTVIQGSAADIIKLAMLAVASDAELRGLKARLLLQVHDELVLEAPKENAPAVAARAAGLMASVAPGGAPLDVPLVVDCGCGVNWGEAR
ncbi:MAG: DNA polymerase I [Desulfovibrio sp.]|jgi:DNA polymerase-1|nr:DNA polymerase I [Desulfovibrio sp.]